LQTWESDQRKEKAMESDKVVVGSFANELDAEFAKGHLEAAGIDAAIVKDDAGSMFPSLQGTEGVQLLVARNDEERARRILVEKNTKTK
jgi:Putative prokaryotic signal transducing protein